MVGGGNDRVIESGSTAGFQLLQCAAQFFGIIGEVLIQIIFITEIDYEHLVLGIAGSDQILGCLGDLVALFPHGAGIVDDNAHRHRDVFVAKGSDWLGLSILEDLKGVASQIGNQTLLFVHYCGV